MQIFFLAFFSLLNRVISYLFGNIDLLFISLLILFVIQYFLAFFLDYKKKKMVFRNYILRLFKIIGYLFFIIMAVILDKIAHLTGEIRSIVLMTLIYNEMILIFKTATSLGFKVPKILISSLQNFLDSLPKEVISTSDKKEN